MKGFNDRLAELNGKCVAAEAILGTVNEEHKNSKKDKVEFDVVFAKYKLEVDAAERTRAGEANRVSRELGRSKQHLLEEISQLKKLSLVAGKEKIESLRLAAAALMQ